MGGWKMAEKANWIIAEILIGKSPKNHWILAEKNMLIGFWSKIFKHDK